MTDPIDMAEHRPHQGTLYWTGAVGCHACGHEHIAIAPIPEWAAAPGSLACPRCLTLTCLPIAYGCSANPWRPPNDG